ncbi:MAG: thiamine-phosphate kinase [Methanophagales archaeon ANME-1-THS]|nr:MAG: thiamine-phosphate kinase [Methanophagales archaeon ANME-1-THS]
MKIEELGERGLIERIVKEFHSEKRLVPAGAGEDDCAVIDIERAKAGYNYLIVTTDTLQESTHFPAGISPFQMGWSIVAVNLSDIAAMGAYPFAFTIALGLPLQTETSFVDELVAGIEKCASSYHTVVVGGDLSRSKELILTGTCIGFADNPVRRSGAKVGDLICVTGSLGNAALAVQVLKGELDVPESIGAVAKRALFQPVPKVNEGILIANSGVATAMIDISDGLALSIAELAKRSKVGAELYEENVPVLSEELRHKRGLELSPHERRELAFYYGGDYELLFTIDQRALTNEDLMNRLKREVQMSIIGTVVPPEEGVYFKKGEVKEMMELKGYQHF